LECTDHASHRLACTCVWSRESIGTIEGGRNMEVRNDLHNLEEMVKGYDGVEEHEERFRHLEYILHFAGCPRLEIADAVVANITNCSSCKRRKHKPWYDRFSIFRQFFLEDWERVASRAMTRPSLQDLPWVWSLLVGPDEAKAILLSPAPTKLYLPIDSELAALSKRKE